MTTDGAGEAPHVAIAEVELESRHVLDDVECRSWRELGEEGRVVCVGPADLRRGRLRRVATGRLRGVGRGPERDRCEGRSTEYESTQALLPCTIRLGRWSALPALASLVRPIDRRFGWRVRHSDRQRAEGQ